MNEIACLLQFLSHILRGTIVARNSSGSVAATYGSNVLQCPQVPEGALGCCRVEYVRNSVTDDVVSALAMRPGGTAARRAAASPILQLARKNFDNGIANDTRDYFESPPRIIDPAAAWWTEFAVDLSTQHRQNRLHLARRSGD